MYLLAIGVASLLIAVPVYGLDSSWLNARELGASGSSFIATGITQKGKSEIEVADPGDFAVGQHVMLFGACAEVTRNIRKRWESRFDKEKQQSAFEVRGYDGSQGSWLVYVVDIGKSENPVFRWTSDMGRNWHKGGPVTNVWVKLENGIEVRFNEFEWEQGCTVNFTCRNRMLNRITKIEGNLVTLRDPVEQSSKNVQMMHNDTYALQGALDKARKEHHNLLVPNGHYRLSHNLKVFTPQGMVIAGESAVHTLLDISNGAGACFMLAAGKEVTIRNFSMLGFMGFDERDKAGNMGTSGYAPTWGFTLKSCNAISIYNTERVLIENCHATRMSGECFAASSRNSRISGEGKSYTKKTTYLRCSVTDSARNAFNDLASGTENTDILQCRIVDVGGCAWEGASRFVNFKGNYVRNAGTVAIGNLGEMNRDDSYPEVGSGQTIVADNTFEQGVCYGGSAVCSSRGATQVIVRNNRFVNFGSSAIVASSGSSGNDHASANTIITGNIIDLTEVGPQSKARIGVAIGANDTIVSDNQIYVRGTNDLLTTGIRIAEPALNTIIHNNIVRNCGKGLATICADGFVGSVINQQTFKAVLRWRTTRVPLGHLPFSYTGHTLVLYRGTRLMGSNEILSFEPLESLFQLKESVDLANGDRFEIKVPAANWNIHNNLILECSVPVELNSHGSETSYLQHNIINLRHNIENAEHIRVLRGQFNINNNLLH